MSEPNADSVERTRQREKRRSTAILLASGVVSLLGLWIAVSPFVTDASAGVRWSNVIVGGAAFLLAGYDVYRIVTEGRSSPNVTSLVAVLGLWILVTPFAIGGQVAVDGLAVATEELVWSNVVAGTVVTAMSGAAAYAAGTSPPTET